MLMNHSTTAALEQPSHRARSRTAEGYELSLPAFQCWLAEMMF